MNTRENVPMDSDVEQTIDVEVRADAGGQRLDRVLASQLPDYSRVRLQALIRAGAVRDAGGLVLDPSRKAKGGERLTIAIPAAVAAAPLGEEIALDIAFEDASLIVLNKPAGLVVHPGNGNTTGTLVNALIAHCGDTLSGIGGVKRPGVVHRLDKETSGLLVVAKTDKAHAGLSDQFASHGLDGRLVREYIALIWGQLDLPKGSIDAHLGRSITNRTRMAVVPPTHGRHAVTHYFTEATYGGIASLLRLSLETGRTHQIRVHMAHVGHPLLGDDVYGSGFATSRSKLAPDAAEALAGLRGQALHAAVLGFEHPVTGQSLRFVSEPPAALKRLIEALKKNVRRPLESDRRTS
jgi:23S rRNA pseudouridine1911/1915/1917 synthase